MHAEIVMIGTELLLGEIVDTNANKLSIALKDIGLDLYYKTTVGDNEDRIVDVLNLALDRSDVVITSGGIGPTVDDVTRQAIARATGRDLVYSKVLEAQIASRFRSFGRNMADNNKRQAYMPEGAFPLENPVGTAPCFLSEDVNGRGCVICLPGVPRELEHMMEHKITPVLIERMGGIKFTKVRVLRTCAVGESNIDRGIGDLMTSSNPSVGLAAHAGQTDVRIAAKADTEAEVDELIRPMEETLRERLGVAIYGVGKETVAEVVGNLLKQEGLSLGVADTLTGGQVVRDFAEAGYGELIVNDLNSDEAASTLELLKKVEATTDEKVSGAMAEKVTPEGGLGLAMVGPFSDGSTMISLRGPNGICLDERGRNFQDSDHIRRWIVIQGLDRIRRVLLGEMESPVDWN
jgi:nicotinamide-nucleotide amidase